MIHRGPVLKETFSKSNLLLLIIVSMVTLGRVQIAILQGTSIKIKNKIKTVIEESLTYLS